MRVLHVMESTIGGTRRHLVDVSSGQKLRGLDVHVAVAARREPAFRRDLAQLVEDGVRVHEVPMVRELKPLVDGIHFARLSRLLQQERPDIVHTHSSKAGVLGRLASLATGIGARVHTPHTFSFLFDAMFSGPKRRLFRLVEEQLALETEVVIAVSPAEARTFQASGVVPAARVRTVINGIEPEPWQRAQPLDRGELGFAPEHPLAVVAGLLNVAKGQDLLLDALADERLGEIQLAVCGHGEEREALEQQSRALGLTERVRFLGWRDDMPALLAAADLLVLPSRWEGMPYIALEAMAAGRGVVSTPVDGASDLILHGRTGLVSESIGAASLAEVLAEWCELDAAARSALGAAGRARVLAGYTLEHTLDGLSEVYERVLGLR